MARTTSNNFPRIIYVYYRSYSFDIGTLEPLEFTVYDYPNGAPVVRLCGGPSQSEINAQQQAAAESQALFQNFQTQFANQQSFISNFLQPQLESMYQNPTGFGPAALADLDANLVNTTGIQAANAKQASQAQFDTANMAGLPSGVEQAIQSQIQSAAGNTVASGQNQINLANQQYKNQQQMTALQDLQNIPSLLGASPQVGGLLTGANANSFSEANKINQQGNFWGNLGQGLLGGIIGQGANLLTGGLANIFNQPSAPTDTSWMPPNAVPGQPYYPPSVMTPPTGVPGVIGAVPT